MKSKSYFLTIIFLVIVGVIGFIVFRHIFSTALHGDEWKILWVGKSALNTTGTILPSEPGDFPYIGQIIVFEQISKTFGYDGRYYHFLSFLPRFFAATTLFWFLIKRKFAPIACFVGTLLFMISPVGVEATTWTRNFDSYLGVILLLAILDRGMLAKKSALSITIWALVIAAILINTTRSHGLILIVTGALTAKALIVRNQKKELLVMIAGIILIFLMISLTPLFGGQPGLFISHPFPFKEFLYSYFGNLGRVVLPVGANLPLFSISTTVGVLATAIFIFILYDKFKKAQKRDFFTLSIIFCLLTLPILVPSIRQPYFHADAEHRYLIYSSLVIPLLIAYISNKLLLSHDPHKGLAIIYLSVVVFYPFSSYTTNHIRFHYINHPQSYTNEVWSNLEASLKESGIREGGKEVIFLTDGQNYPKVNASVYFGFMFHAGLIYNIWELEKLPEAYIFWDEKDLNRHLEKPTNKKRILLKIIDSRVDRI